MPVTYLSSTGALSFAPVAPRDQAVGPLEVARAHSPPDEIIAPPRRGIPGTDRHYRKIILTTALMAAGAMLLAA